MDATLVTPKRRIKPTWMWMRLVIAVAAVIRLTMLLTSPPAIYNDTPAYRRLAEAVADGWRNYDGTRTPGYPAFMALSGSDVSVYGMQLLLGFAITLGMFYLGWRMSGSPFFGALAGLVHTLNMQQILFEASLLSETLATFLVFAAMLGAYLWMKGGGAKTWSLAIGIGLAASLAGLTRALFFFLPVWLALWLGFVHPGSLRKPDWRAGAGILLPCLVLLGGWTGFIYRNFGMISLSTMNGYHLVQHTGAFFEYVPDEYSQLRDTFIMYRDARIEAYGTPGNAIWDAIPELQQVSGLSFYDLSRTLSRISIQLIREHPGLYLKSAAQGWWMFWRGPVYWQADQMENETLRAILTGLKRTTQAVLFGANLIFLASSALALLLPRLRAFWKITPFLALTAATIWATSVVQTLLDHGDNPRFLVPLQSLGLLWVFWIGWQAWNQRHQRAPA